MPKTILYLDHTAELSGGEIALFQLVTSLDSAQYVPVVVLASEGPLAAKLRAAGVETHIFPLSEAVTQVRKDSLGWKSLLRLREAVVCARYAAHLARFARQRGAALIHTNSLKADLLGGLAGRLARLPVLWHVRDNIDAHYLPAHAAAAFRRLAQIVPDVVVTNSQSTLRRLRLRPSKQVAVVYSGCPVGDFAAPPATIPQADGPVIGLFGRIAPWKGQHILLQAAPRVLTRFPAARFWIVGAPLFGEHDYLEQLKAQAEELGISRQVDFMGFRTDVPALMHQVTVVAHTSITDEPFGQVVVQGMTAGKPIVAADGGALPEIVVPSETGLLVPPGDADALADALCDLIGAPDRAQAYGLAGRSRVFQRFTLEQSAAKMQAVYGSVLKTPGPLKSMAESAPDLSHAGV